MGSESLSIAEKIYDAISEESRKLTEGQKFYSYEPPDEETRKKILSAIRACLSSPWVDVASGMPEPKE